MPSECLPSCAILNQTADLFGIQLVQPGRSLLVYCALGWHAVQRTGIGTPGHVGDGRADVAVRPERPVQVHFRACRSFGLELRGARADLATSGVASTLDVGQSHVLDRTIALHRARDAVRLFELSVMVSRHDGPDRSGIPLGSCKGPCRAGRIHILGLRWCRCQPNRGRRPGRLTREER